ncbi:MAG TPA: septal ring lytic transglycosylase RlpA family protein, partial [Leptospiraceae bacterium]|nr:septal ring lytic transglycosylase RlpA family protein [Leptospiraceae bacterium]
MKQILIILGIVAMISCQSTQEIREATKTVEESQVIKEETKETSKTIATPKYDEIGFASWYGIQFQGKVTASGEVFDRFKMTAAHRTIPFGSVVKVQNLENNKEADVTINDRGPADEGSIIEVTEKAAEILNFKEESVAKVGINIIKPMEENPILVKDDSFSVDDDDDDDDDDDIDEETAPPAKKPDAKKPQTVTPVAPDKKPAPAPAPAPVKTAPANNSKTT